MKKKKFYHYYIDDVAAESICDAIQTYYENADEEPEEEDVSGWEEETFKKLTKQMKGEEV